MAADLDAVSEEEDFAAGVAYRKAKKEKRQEKGTEDRGALGGGNHREEGRTLNGVRRKTGELNR